MSEMKCEKCGLVKKFECPRETHRTGYHGYEFTHKCGGPMVPIRCCDKPPVGPATKALREFFSRTLAYLEWKEGDPACPGEFIVIRSSFDVKMLRDFLKETAS